MSERSSYPPSRSGLPEHPGRFTPGFLGCAAAIGLAFPGFSDAGTRTLVDCLLQPVSFDHAEGLSYGVVRGGPGAPPFFFTDYPKQCDASDPEGCPGRDQLLPGDVVAIGKTCDNWAFVRLISQPRHRIGWIAASRLIPRRPPDHET